MKLYRIRRKSDGKFFVCFFGIPMRGREQFGPSGTFWKQEETAIKNLRYLCLIDFGGPRGTFGQRQTMHSEKHDWKLLKDYEIVITDVTVNNETAVDAAEYFKQEAA